MLYQFQTLWLDYFDFICRRSLVMKLPLRRFMQPPQFHPYISCAKANLRVRQSENYEIWGFHGGDCEEYDLLIYKTPVRTSQETNYVSATELSQLMLCKIWGFHGSDYEECRLLGYKTPVRASQETHYFSATESSQLMLCKICGLHGDNYEESRILGYKIPVFTSQETHYFSSTDLSRLMLRFEAFMAVTMRSHTV
jgi:hypothetical protein